MQGWLNKRAITWVLLLLTIFTFTGVSSVAPLAQAKNEKAKIQNLQQKKKSKQSQLKRIKALKYQIILKEQYVTRNILKNQQRLESSQSSLDVQNKLLNDTKNQLAALEKSLDMAIAEQQELADQVGKRLRSFYMGEHISFLHVLLDAGNLSTLMDRMYYKKRIFNRDKVLYESYRQKTLALEEKKDDLARHKDRLAMTISKIEDYQSQLQEAMVLDRLLVKKLQTSKEAYEMAENQLERESYNIERQIMSLTASGGYVLGSTGIFARPILSAITSPFGYRVHPIFRTSRLHSGIDFGGGYGTPIRAADGGRVITAGWQGGYGKVVIVNHGTKAGKNLTTLYGHMSRIAVNNGQSVGKGQVLGYVGSTGFSTGPHLHFEVRENGRPVNPLKHLR